MSRQVVIAGAVFAAFLAVTLSGCGGESDTAAAASDPPAAPAIEQPPTETGATVSKIQMPANQLKEINDGMDPKMKMAAGSVSGMTFTVSGLGQDSECRKAMEVAWAECDEGQCERTEKKVQMECEKVASSINKVWVQFTFEAGVVKSQTDELEIDGPALVAAIAEGKKVKSGEEKMGEAVQKHDVTHVDEVGLDMNLNKITLWAALNSEFLKKITSVTELDGDKIKTMATPPSANELKRLADSALSRTLKLTSKMLSGQEPRSKTTSTSVVARRLANDFTEPAAPSGACSLDFPVDLINQAAAAGKKEGAPVEIPTLASATYKIAGLPDTCCTKLKETLSKVPNFMPDPATGQPKEMPDVAGISAACEAGLASITGIWTSAGFAPKAKMPLSSMSGYDLVNGPKLKEYMDTLMAAKADPTKMPAQQKKMAYDMVAGFDRFYASMSWAKTQVHVSFKNFVISKAGGSFTYDEAMAKALVKSLEQAAVPPGPDVFDQMYEAAWSIMPRPAHLEMFAHQLNLHSAPAELKEAVASPVTIGAASLAGSLALIGVVAGAFIVRKRRQQVRDVQAATEMTSQEIAA